MAHIGRRKSGVSRSQFTGVEPARRLPVTKRDKVSQQERRPMDMDLGIDKPSALAAVVIGLAACLLVDVGGGARYVEAQEVPAARASAASGPTTRAGCPTTTAAGRPLPATPSSRNPPAGPTDLQVNSSGTGAAGAGGTIGTQPADPCEPARTLGQRARGAASAIDGSEGASQANKRP
jgi:hypothetical protein